MVSKCCVLILVLVFCAHGEKDTRSNVVFVIDDTISMSLEIRQVKENVQEIFSAVLGSKKSEIGNFILITFNDNEVSMGDDMYVDDPDLEPIVVRADTRDPNKFLKKLNEIKVDGGGYCPELCLTGIKRAIEESNPNSFIYVFTDASAKDYKEEDTVRKMAEKKSIQITFLLTGVCDDSSSEDYIVYEKLAKATSGEVFHIEKKNVNKIMKYIIKCIDNPKTTLITQPIGPGINKVNFTVDGDMTDVSVAAGVERGTNVNYNLTDPHGKDVPAKELVNTDSSKASSIPNPEKGTYTATVNSESSGTVVVKATINIQFQYGFSAILPASMNNTRTRPLPDIESYLAIMLKIFDDKVNVKLKSVFILDIEDKQLMEMPAKVLNEESKFYVTAPFKPPNGSFKVAIVAIAQDSGEKIIRIARTPVEAQSYPEKITHKRPDVKIEFGPKISVKYGSPLILECKVNAYPKPKIVWEDKESGTELESSASILELPYDYVSILKIENITQTKSYKCKASINSDEVTDDIEVETFRPKFWKLVEEPKDTNIEYKKDAEIHCKVNAWPPPIITWYKDDKKLTNDYNFHLFDDKTTLFIKNMLPELEGRYSCKASNDEDNLTTLNFTINMSGGEPPMIDKTNPSMPVKEGMVADIPCRVVKGLPTPTITWEFKETDSKEFIQLSETGQMIHIDAVDLKDAGVYKCTANNRNGEDFYEIDLTVQCLPKIDKSKTNAIFNKGTEAVISCRILKGMPKPDITWEFKRKDASNFVFLSEKEEDIVINTVDLENSGLYRCSASNVVGKDSHETELTVEYAPIVVVKQVEQITVNDQVTLHCEVTGEPVPVVRWSREGIIINADTKYTIFKDNSLRFTARVEDRGNYTCEGSNYLGKEKKNVTLVVNEPPMIDKTNPSMPVKEGMVADIPCRVVKGLPTPTITWEFKGKDSKEFIRLSESEQMIHIDAVELKDAGVYKCTANNRNGEDFHEIDLTVQCLPKIDKSKTNAIFNKGTEAVISCRILKGIPKPDITWEFKRKDARNFVFLSEKEEDIVINTVDLEDSGLYRCSASNVVGKDSHETELTVEYAPIVVIKQVEQMKVSDQVTLHCEVTGEPDPVVRWSKEGTTINADAKYTIFKDNSLRFIARVEDRGNYTCEGSNYLGKDKKNVTLVVNESPVIDKTNPSKSVKEGMVAEIPCRIIKGTPKPDIIWEFKRKGASEFINLSEKGQDIIINTVDLENSGSYRCTASNVVGKDIHVTELTVENAPNVVVKQPVPVKIGDQVTLHCEATGEPEPAVRWSKEGKAISADTKYTIFKDNSLRFIVSVEDRGNYTCEGSNYRGVDKKNVTLSIYGPVKIDLRTDTVLNPNVGSDVELLCDASGDPKPNITWKFLSSDSKDYPVRLPNSNSNRLKLSKIKAESAGHYICIADNTFDNKSITYEVKVNVPVEIEKPEQTEFNIVEYDFVLRIPCKAKGYPEPTVTWMVNGLPLILGYGEYDGEPDGTLVIMLPDKSAENEYVCMASNGNSNALEFFTVKVSSYPIPTEPMKTIYVEKGTTRNIQCDLSYTTVDSIRWYKDGIQIEVTPPDFIITDAMESDSGIYSCRVSSTLAAYSSHMQIVVGTKPNFVNPQRSPNIPFVFGQKVRLDCEANGIPTPRIMWWDNGIISMKHNMVYELTMYDGVIGEKRCKVSNAFGTVIRTFVINNSGCKIDFTKVDLDKYHPLVVTGRGKLNEFENKDGIMIVPESKTVTFKCPSKENKFNCFNNEFTKAGYNQKYEDLKCDTELRPKTKQLLRGKPCSSDPRSILIAVGYGTLTGFSGLYDVCYSRSNNQQIFIRYNLNRYASNIEIDNKKSYLQDYTFYSHDEMFHCDKTCCFAGRQLISARDLPPGLQKATYFNINVVPQWNVCGNIHNWDEIEKRIRNLAKTVTFSLEVYSGGHDNQKGFLEDKYSNKIKISKYLWKVVQIKDKNLALAIIILNVPNLTAAEAKTHVFCTDICDRTDWMANTEWRNEKHGYTFCCNAWEFAKVVGPQYQRIFKRKLLLTRNIN